MVGRYPKVLDHGYMLCCYAFCQKCVDKNIRFFLWHLILKVGIVLLNWSLQPKKAEKFHIYGSWKTFSDHFFQIWVIT